MSSSMSKDPRTREADHGETRDVFDPSITLTSGPHSLTNRSNPGYTKRVVEVFVVGAGLWVDKGG